VTASFEPPIVPLTASPQVEFVSQIHWNPSTELNPIKHRGLDRSFVRQYASALDAGGFDYTLVPYFSSSPESYVLATAVGAFTERIKPVVAARPNHTFPLVAAQKLATLDQLTDGRAVVHLITGGFDAEQRRHGDYLPKDRRYARTSEYIDLLRRAWTEEGPFSFEGEFYKFDEFGPGFATYSGDPIPISLGGQSDEAFAVGAAKADWFAFNAGESVEQIRTDIERVNAIARAAGRPNP
jgi:alkanesulfonate monooxygenase